MPVYIPQAKAWGFDGEVITYTKDKNGIPTLLTIFCQIPML